MHAGQEATVRTGHGTTDWFQIGKTSKLKKNITSASLTTLKFLYNRGNYKQGEKTAFRMGEINSK